jgi:hypothetical protein
MARSHNGGSVCALRTRPPARRSPGRGICGGSGVAPPGWGVFLLGWIGQGGYSVVETYGGLGGGWAQLLVLLAVGAGVVVGGCLVLVARLLDRATRARWLVLTGVVSRPSRGCGRRLPGFLAHTAASARAEHACDDPVGRALVSFAEGLDPGPLVIQDGELTRGRDDGRCLVLVNVAPDADVAAEIARVAAANSWSRSQDGWLSPDGVSMTYDATLRTGHDDPGRAARSPSRPAVTAPKLPTLPGPVPTATRAHPR